MLYGVLSGGLRKITWSVGWLNKARFGGECIKYHETTAIIPYTLREESEKKADSFQVDCKGGKSYTKVSKSLGFTLN